ncbi:radical SAM protein [Patescibacteria group bacterium]|nr:radical SAM protein [Patescibacteria group bacterium]
MGKEIDKDTFQLFWEIVPASSCNFQCLNCYAADNARPDKRLLDWNEMKVALEKVIALGTKKIDVLGGEPLTYKHLEKFVKYFKSKVEDGFCGVVSNGSLITKARARSLLNAGLDQITISLDGTKAEINDANRGKGTFNQALIGIENTIEVGLPLTIAYTITPFNTSDTSNLFSFVQKLGAKALSVQITEMLGRAKKTLKGINTFNWFEGLRAISKMFRQRPPTLYRSFNKKFI